MAEAREAWRGEPAVISVACHHAEEAAEAPELGASMIVFAPVFEKSVRERDAEVMLPGSGLAALSAACKAAGDVPVLALGGVTAENAGLCIEAGAAGVAGIRLFLGDAWMGLGSGPNR
jgi:thiamine-phosphate pyrophosphorylase